MKNNEGQSWTVRYKQLKKDLGLTNKTVALLSGNTYESVKTVTQPNKELPRWLKFAIIIHESHQHAKEQEDDLI